MSPARALRRRLYEHRSEPLLPVPRFVQRLVKHWLVSMTLLIFSLGLGTLGYHGTERMSWLDALLNASMILGGMGPVDVLHTNGGKVFASAYALYSGITFLAIAGILVAPLAHRLLHALHLEDTKR